MDITYFHVFFAKVIREALTVTVSLLEVDFIS